MQVFLINLDKDIDRLSFMDQQLSSMNISYQRISGTVPTKEIKDKYYDSNFILKKYQSHFRDGEIGCALSHYFIYQKIVNENIKKSIIFEDDIHIDHQNFLKVFEMLNKRDNWEYVSLNYDTFDKDFRNKYLWSKSMNPFRKALKGLLIFLYRPIEIFQHFYGIVFGPTIFSVIRPLHLCGCYFITFEGAKKILSTHGDKIRYLADYVQNEAKIKNKLNIHFIAPQITKQANEKFSSNTR